MKIINWGEFPLPLIQVNPPDIALSQKLILKAYTNGKFSNSAELNQEASAVLGKHVHHDFEGYLVSSNTSGLVASLMAIGVRNRHVLLSNFTFAATLEAVILAGGIPVVCDVDEVNLELNVEQIKIALNEGIFDFACVLPTRVLGFISDFSELVEFCNQKGIAVVIDAAASFPSSPETWNFRTQAHIEVFSLHATKVFGIGEGGLVVGNKEIINKVKQKSNFGLRPDGSQKFEDGLNAKADEFTAARALARFPKYRNDVVIRQNFAQEYDSIFAESKKIRTFSSDRETIYSYYPILFDTEENLYMFAAIVNEYILTRRYYFPSLSEGYIGDIKLQKIGNLENADSISKRMLCLPVYVSCSDEAKKQIKNLFANAIRVLK